MAEMDDTVSVDPQALLTEMLHQLLHQTLADRMAATGAADARVSVPITRIGQPPQDGLILTIYSDGLDVVGHLRSAAEARAHRRAFAADADAVIPLPGAGTMALQMLDQDGKPRRRADA